MIDIILPAYNCNRWIEESINSILNQSYKDWHLYIIDDNSTNKESIKIIEKMIVDNNKITLIKNEKNLKAPGSRMKAIRRTSGEYITFIDQDDIWHEDKLKKQIEIFKKYPDVDFVYGDLELINQNGELIKGSNTKVVKNNDKQNFTINELISKLGTIRIGTVMVKRKPFLNIGGFDTKLFGGEEWDAWLKIIISGANFYHLNDILAYRRIHDNNVSKVYLKERFNNVIVMLNKFIDSEYGDSVKRFKQKYVLLRIINMIEQKHYKECKDFINEYIDDKKKKILLLGISNEIGKLLIVKYKRLKNM
ncbi:glycosyltransferase [Neobacillus sp. 3P2-tot-E-2]|uniref:glycosyltransferase n=1 Tax=Neobacillus sp. 3P2-tot-E-2 TaxID=3132212 RepID=UPI0039A0E330